MQRWGIVLSGLIIILSGMWITYGFSKEKRTIAVFYPSPYGEYEDLRTKFIAVGSDLMDSSVYPADGGFAYVQNGIVFKQSPGGGIKLEYSEIGTNSNLKLELGDTDSFEIRQNGIKVFEVSKSTGGKKQVCVNGWCREKWFDPGDYVTATSFCPGKDQPCRVDCPDNTILVTGGCECDNGSGGNVGLTRNRPSGNGWVCMGDCDHSTRAFARCVYKN